jgi:hypothetical protein
LKRKLTNEKAAWDVTVDIETIWSPLPLWSETVVGHQWRDWQSAHGPDTQVVGCDDSWETESCY